ncbi:hypothetical protein ES703_101970 [subsurface metagenome]
MSLYKIGSGVLVGVHDYVGGLFGAAGIVSPVIELPARGFCGGKGYWGAAVVGDRARAGAYTPTIQRDLRGGQVALCNGTGDGDAL